MKNCSLQFILDLDERKMISLSWISLGQNFKNFRCWFRPKNWILKGNDDHHQCHLMDFFFLDSVTKLNNIAILGEPFALISDLHTEHSRSCLVSTGIGYPIAYMHYIYIILYFFYEFHLKLFCSCILVFHLWNSASSKTSWKVRLQYNGFTVLLSYFKEAVCCVAVVGAQYKNWCFFRWLYGRNELILSAT